MKWKIKTAAQSAQLAARAPFAPIEYLTRQHNWKVQLLPEQSVINSSSILAGYNHCSLPVEVLELAAGLLLARRDVALVVDVDDALGMQLVEDALGLLILLLQALVVRQLLFGRGDELQLGGDLLFPVRLGLLGLLDLLPGAAALAGGLQHIGRHALRNCIEI